MDRYRKKPVEIEAVRLLNSAHPEAIATPREIAVWCGGTVVTDVELGKLLIDIPTLEGTMRATEGDWVIKGIKGEFYPCKPDIFAATYDKV